MVIFDGEEEEGERGLTPRIREQETNSVAKRQT